MYIERQSLTDLIICFSPIFATDALFARHKDGWLVESWGLLAWCSTADAWVFEFANMMQNIVDCQVTLLITTLRAICCLTRLLCLTSTSPFLISTGLRLLWRKTAHLLISYVCIIISPVLVLFGQHVNTVLADGDMLTGNWLNILW